jgi:hypothetical protein
MTDYSAAQPAIRDGVFSITGSLKRAFSIFFANFISFNVLGLITMVPGIVVVGLLFGAIFASLFLAAPGAGAAPDFGVIHAGTFFLVWVFMMTLQYFLAAVIVYGALRYLQGSKAGIGACLGQGLRRLPAIFGIAVLTTILVFVGMILLIVPGIIVGLMICLAIPALMVEDTGVTGSLKRSRELTKGYRWHLFGLFLLAFVISTAVAIIVPMPVNLVLPEVVGIVVSGLLQLLTTVFFAVLLAVAYHDLRVAKEGVSTSQLAAVFD